MRKEVNLNCWLKEKGWLKFRGETAGELKEIDPSSMAYSLLPGRIYRNSREDGKGSGGAGESREWQEEMTASLLQLSDPTNGERMIQKVYRGDEIYHGSFRKDGPDFVAVPIPGYDLKGNFSATQLTVESRMAGMHTDDDAFLYVRSHQLKGEGIRIIDVYPTILSLMKVAPDQGVDGVSLIS